MFVARYDVQKLCTKTADIFLNNVPIEDVDRYFLNVVEVIQHYSDIQCIKKAYLKYVLLLYDGTYHIGSCFVRTYHIGSCFVRTYHIGSFFVRTYHIGSFFVRIRASNTSLIRMLYKRVGMS